MTSDATKNSSNNQNENIPESTAPQTGPEEPVPDTNKNWNLRKFLVSLLLALILFAGIVAVSWQFYGDKLQKISWLSKKTQEQETSRQGEIYYCPMHKKYQSDKPGSCPICSMQLVKMEKSDSAGTGTSQNRPPGGGMPRMPGMDMPGKSAPAPSSSDSPNTIFVSPEQQQIIGVQTAPAALRSLTKEIRTVGKVSFDETKVTHIHSKVSGWIERVFVDFVGKSVKQGDPLFTLYSPDLVSTQQEYLLALRAKKSLADSSFERVSEGARNLVEATRQRLRLWDVTEDEIGKLEKEGKAQRELTIYSPVGGVVTERAAYHHGRYITPDLDLYTIVDLSTVWVLGEIYEYELPLVRQGQRVEVDMPYESAGRPLTATVTYIYPYLNPTTRTGQIRMEFSNYNANLKPDMFVDLKLRIGLGRQLTVPEHAVLNTGTQQYVFVDKGNGYFEPREVSVGVQAEGHYAIQKGLKPGDKVVTAANFILDSESRLRGAFANMGTPRTEMPRPERTIRQVQITLRSEPDPAKVGDNTIRVRVADAVGAPITDASVRVRIFMPAMGAMPPMSSEAQLSHQANGEYSGRLNIPMAWTWQTTVTVERGGHTLGSRQFNLTAR